MSLLLLVGVTLSASAQQKQPVKQKDVPANIQTALKNAYPTASDIEWKLKDGMYKAKFEVDGKDHMAGINSSGEIISKGSEILKTELPAAITTAIQTAHTGYNIDDVYKVEEGGATKYLVELDGNPDKKVLYSSDGKLEKEMTDDDA